MAALVERLEAFFKEKDLPGVVGVYLFGSQAGGRVHRDSDVDVGVLVDRVVLPTARARFELKVRLASQLIDIAGDKPVDVVILNDAPPELARHIAVSGQRLFATSAELNHAFVRDAQLMAADIAPFLRRTRRLKLEALKS